MCDEIEEDEVHELSEEDQVQQSFDQWLDTYQKAQEGLRQALRKMHRIGRYPRPPEAVRFNLADERKGMSHGFKLGAGEDRVKLYVETGTYNDGGLGEIFLRADKTGSMINGLMDSFATLFSIALQFGVPVERLVNKFKYVRFEPAGMTKGPVRSATSMIDYVAKWLELRYIQPEEEKIDGAE